MLNLAPIPDPPPLRVHPRLPAECFRYSVGEGGGCRSGRFGTSHLYEPPIQGQVRYAEGLATVLSSTGAQEPDPHPEAESAAAARPEPAALSSVELVQCHPRRQAVRVLEAVDRADEAAVFA